MFYELLRDAATRHAQVYFVGRSSAQKVSGNPHLVKNNYGYDDDRGDYQVGRVSDPWVGCDFKKWTSKNPKMRNRRRATVQFQVGHDRGDHQWPVGRRPVGKVGAGATGGDFSSKRRGSGSRLVDERRIVLSPIGKTTGSVGGPGSGGSAGGVGTIIDTQQVVLHDRLAYRFRYVHLHATSVLIHIPYLKYTPLPAIGRAARPPGVPLRSALHHGAGFLRAGGRGMGCVHWRRRWKWGPVGSGSSGQVGAGRGVQDVR